VAPASDEFPKLNFNYQSTNFSNINKLFVVFQFSVFALISRLFLKQMFKHIMVLILFGFVKFKSVHVLVSLSNEGRETANKHYCYLYSISNNLKFIVLFSRRFTCCMYKQVNVTSLVSS